MRTLLTLVMLVVCLPDAVSAQTAPVPFHIPVATESVTLDGAVTEALWEGALKLDLRYEVRPGENIVPPVRTEMLLAYDDANLYESLVSSVNRDLFAQLLFSYKVNAQTALYFGYVSGASATDQFPLRQVSQLFAKLSYAWLR